MTNVELFYGVETDDDPNAKLLLQQTDRMARRYLHAKPQRKLARDMNDVNVSAGKRPPGVRPVSRIVLGGDNAYHTGGSGTRKEQQQQRASRRLLFGKELALR